MEASQAPLKWSAGPEDSVVATGMSILKEPTLERCWKRDGEYECLRVEASFLHDKSEPDSFDFFRYHAAQLPQRLPLLRAQATDGYQCSFSRDMRIFSEEIYRGGTKLTSNLVSSMNSGAPWPREFAKRYMAENKVGGWRYFECGAVADVVDRGSLSSLGTTLVTYSMVK